MVAPLARAALRTALTDAGLTAVLAFLLLLPLIGFKTVQNIRNEIALETRWPLLFTFVAIAVAGRLLYSLVIAPWRERRAARSRPPRKAAIRLRQLSARWFAPFCAGFVLVYPALSIWLAGFQGAVKWIDNFGIQILIYVMLGLGLNIVVGLAGLLDLGYVAFYAVGAYSYALLAKTFGFSFFMLLPLAGMPRGVLGHPARLSGAAPARRLSRHRHARVRRDHPAGADQLGRPDQRLCRHQRHSAPDLLRHPVQRRRRRLRGDLRARVQPDLPHHLPLLSHPRARAAHRLRHDAAAPPADRARLGGAARGRDRLPLARHQHHQHQAHRLRHGRDVRRLRRLVLRRAPGLHLAGILHLPRIGDDPRHRRARRHGQPDRRRDRRRRDDRRHRDPARARRPQGRVRPRLRPDAIPHADVRLRHGGDHDLAAARADLDARALGVPGAHRTIAASPVKEGRG